MEQLNIDTKFEDDKQTNSDEPSYDYSIITKQQEFNNTIYIFYTILPSLISFVFIGILIYILYNKKNIYKNIFDLINYLQIKK